MECIEEEGLLKALTRLSIMEENLFDSPKKKHKRLVRRRDAKKSETIQERRNLIKFQDEEYAASLARDIAKDEERARAEKAKQEEVLSLLFNSLFVILTSLQKEQLNTQSEQFLAHLHEETLEQRRERLAAAAMRRFASPSSKRNPQRYVKITDTQHTHSVAL